ncbi:survival protein sure-like phosphatase/nucleotidase [Mycena vulgaris]|nr:survival protein sure-like phosphatase/nucleotidase [Mycena vulgaris]
MAPLSVFLLTLFLAVSAQKIVVTNDDGWAVAQIRAQNDALKAAGYDVVLSCPALNKSGSGSSTTTPTVLTSPCEFDTCPTGSPAEGFNANDTRLNYVNGFPVDAVQIGIQTLAPKFFDGSKPDLVLSGPNVGTNLGLAVLFSGTVGAASEAALEGIPSVAISATTGEEVSYTTLATSPTSADTQAALIYSQLTVRLVDALLDSPEPILPPGISLNVNYPSTSGCTSAAAFKFVLTRINFNLFATDVLTCGTTRLPTESSVVGQSGCFASVSVFDASNKGDVNATTQGVVLAKLSSLLTCSN